MIVNTCEFLKTAKKHSSLCLQKTRKGKYRFLTRALEKDHQIMGIIQKSNKQRPRRKGYLPYRAMRLIPRFLRVRPESTIFWAIGRPWNSLTFTPSCPSVKQTKNLKIPPIISYIIGALIEWAMYKIPVVNPSFWCSELCHKFELNLNLNKLISNKHTNQEKEFILTQLNWYNSILPLL